MTDITISKGIENIIFDFGGVILNINYYAAAQKFKDLGCIDFDELYSQQKQSGLFDEFEIGKISPQAFINELLRVLPNGVKPKQVIDAWNAMLLDLPQKRTEKLSKLKKEYRTFLLSNTNQIHEEAFTRIIQKENQLESLEPLFEQVYLSHKIGLRKPNTDVFQFVIDNNNLVPEKTLFIDDSPQHLVGAQKLGIKTLLYA